LICVKKMKDKEKVEQSFVSMKKVKNVTVHFTYLASSICLICFGFRLEPISYNLPLLPQK
jgi:hypothetical protein